MGRIERENMSKKVKLISQIFAVLASLGILLIGLQFFSKTTGFDLFNINYSLSKLFANESPESRTSASRPVSSVSSNIGNGEISDDESKNLLIPTYNNISIAPIKPSTGVINTGSNEEVQTNKFSVIQIAPLLYSTSLYNPDMVLVNANNLSQNGILPKVKYAKISKWSLGISLSPGVCYRSITYVNQDKISTPQNGGAPIGLNQTKADRNALDKSLMKFSMSVDLNYRFNEKLSLQSGLVYLNFGESVLLKENTADVNTAPGQGASYSDDFFEGNPDFESPDPKNSENNVRYANNVSYAEVPLVLNYRIKSINDIANLEVQLGLSLTKLNFANTMVYNFNNHGYYLVSGRNPEVYQKYGSNAILGVAYNKYITNRIQLFVNPQIKYSLSNAFHKNYMMNQHYYFMGVRLGMKINL